MLFMRPVMLAAALICWMAAVKAAPPDDLVSACTDDAKKLCSYVQLIEASVGHYKGIAKCFRAHRNELSPPCNRMVTKYGYK